MTAKQIQAKLATGLSILIVGAVLATGLTGAVGAQSSPVVTFDTDSGTVDSPTDVSLVATDIPADDSIGAYELTLTYDTDIVDVTVGGTDRFDVSTDTAGSSGTVTKSVVGYTGASGGDGGNMTLAEVTVSPGSDSGDTSLSVSNIESFNDTEGNAVSYSLDADIALSVSSGDDNTGDDNTGDDNTGDGDGGDSSVGSGDSGDTETTEETTEEPTSTNTEDSTATTTPDSTETTEPVNTDSETESDPATEENEPESTEAGGPGFTVLTALFALISFALFSRLR